MSKQFNVAIVGLGGMGNNHRKRIADVENINVYGSFDIREERQEFARENGLYAYGSFEELLADEKIDIVICATPNDAHYDIVVRSLRAGKNVICEKPAAMSSEEFGRMVKVSEETGKLLVVHQNRRWDQDYLSMKKIFEEKSLGEVFKIESRVHGSRGIPGDWRKDPKQGGGMILDWGVHIMDQALQMMNCKLKTVYSRFTNVTNEQCEDGFTVELAFENGVIYVVEVGTRNYISLAGWYLLAFNGTAVINNRWDITDNKITKIHNHDKNDAVPIIAGAGLTKTMAPRTEETVLDDKIEIVESDGKDFYRNVMATIEGKEEILVKNHEVMRCLKLMEACFESARLHQVIDFE